MNSPLAPPAKYFRRFRTVLAVAESANPLWFQRVVLGMDITGHCVRTGLVRCPFHFQFTGSLVASASCSAFSSSSKRATNILRWSAIDCSRAAFRACKRSTSWIRASIAEEN